MVDSTDRGRYLATGWRVVGPDADVIAERVASDGREQLKPGNAADTLYAIRFTLPATVDGRPTVDAVLELITDELRLRWPDHSRLTRESPVEIPASRLEGLRYTMRTEPGQQWLGELLWRSVHPVVAGAPVTTRVVIEGRSAYTRVGVRVTADDGIGSVRGYVGAGQAQPTFVRSLRREGLRPTWLGGPLRAHAIQNGAVPDLVRSVLASQDRKTPVVLLSPVEEGDTFSTRTTSSGSCWGAQSSTTSPNIGRRSNSPTLSVIDECRVSGERLAPTCPDGPATTIRFIIR